MPGRITIRVDGARQVQAALTELGPAAAGRVARSALNRAAQPILKRARELAPQLGAPDDPYATGELRKAITKRLRRYRAGSNRQVAVVGVERPRSRILHLLEYGTAFMAAEPFMRPALDEEAHEAIRIAREAMGQGIDREVRRLAVRALTKAGFR